MKDFSYITHSHPAYIENLYKEFAANPESVDPEFRKFFEGFDFAQANGTGSSPLSAEPGSGSELANEFAVYNLILAYRKKGHLIAKTNPIRERKDRGANLGLSHFGLTEADLGQNFNAGKFVGLGTAPLSKIISQLEGIYTAHIGVEYQYIVKQDRIDWLEKEFEYNLLQHLPI